MSCLAVGPCMALEAADVQVIALVDRTGGFMVLRPTLACVMPVERPARVVCGVLTLS